MRNNLGWSSTQVMVRFTLVQIMFTLVSLVILIKVR
jgi:UDP-N-acetylmuramyl pentapeptide phosphotransferase/UDP-N-acetylglucosamine-1-phosphate transferase